MLLEFLRRKAWLSRDSLGRHRKSLEKQKQLTCGPGQRGR